MNAEVIMNRLRTAEPARKGASVFVDEAILEKTKRVLGPTSLSKLVEEVLKDFVESAGIDATEVTPVTSTKLKGKRN